MRMRPTGRRRLRGPLASCWQVGASQPDWHSSQADARPPVPLYSALPADRVPFGRVSLRTLVPDFYRSAALRFVASLCCEFGFAPFWMNLGLNMQVALDECRIHSSVAVA